MLAVVGDAQK
jgi:hypothetical protein